MIIVENRPNKGEISFLHKILKKYVLENEDSFS